MPEHLFICGYGNYSRNDGWELWCHRCQDWLTPRQQGAPCPGGFPHDAACHVTAGASHV